MMHHKVLIILAALFGIYQFVKIKHVLSKVILILQVVGIAITLLPIPLAITSGFSIFILSGILASFHPFIEKDTPPAKKSLMLAIILPVTIANIFAIARFPFAGVLGFFMLIPLVTLLYIIIKRQNGFKNEIGFLVIFATDALIKLLMSIEWISFN